MTRVVVLRRRAIVRTALELLVVVAAVGAGWYAPLGTPVAAVVLGGSLLVLGAFAFAPLLRRRRPRVLVHVRLEVADDASVLRAVERAHKRAHPSGGAR